MLNLNPHMQHFDMKFLEKSPVDIYDLGRHPFR